MRLYVTEYQGHRVTMFDPDFNYLGSFGSYGSEPGEFFDEWAILPLQSGDLWVSNTYNYRIDVFSYVATAVRQVRWCALKALYR